MNLFFLSSPLSILYPLSLWGAHLFLIDLQVLFMLRDNTPLPYLWHICSLSLSLGFYFFMEFLKCRSFKYCCKPYPSFFSFMALSFGLMPRRTFSTQRADQHLPVCRFSSHLMVFWLLDLR